MRYEDASGAFQASGPVANDDSDTLAAGSRGPATGNLITGEGTQYGSSGADSAAGAHVTAIAGKGGEDSSFAGGKLSVAGEYGQLSVDGEGNYSYLANKGAPENVRDRFTYTLADNQGNSDTAALIVEIGKTPVVIKADAQQIVPGPDGVVTLPPGVELSDIMVVGRNLVINMPDGTQLIIVDGAVFVPQLSLGGVEIPASNVAALLIGQEPQPAAGETPPSSGGNFALPPPPLDPGVPLGDLIPPTARDYIPPAPQETFLPLDEEPEVFVQPDGQPASVNAVDQVEEAGLPERDGDLPDEPAGSGEIADGNGTNNSHTGEATAGTIIINAPDGVGSITINGELVTGVVGQEIEGDFGTLTITGFSGDDILYSYLLHDNTDGNDTHDDFSVVLTDEDGDVASATLRIDIIDDVPTARPDTDTVGDGENPFVATGNVMTDAAPGDAGDSDTNAADTVGADNARVTFIDSVNAAPGANVPDGSFVDIAGQFGTLRIFSNGDYEYTRGQDTPGGVQDVFNYTLTDGDGDTSTTTLTINIPDSPPNLPDPAAVLLDDDALANGNPGGVGDDVDSQGTPGQLVGTGGDGDLDYAFAGPNTLPAGFTVNLVNASTMQILQGGTVVLTVTLNTETGAFSVVQNNPIDHPAGLDENNLSFGIGVQVIDADGDTEGATITINVDDDTPIALEAQVTGAVDEDGVIENAAPGLQDGDGIAGGVGDAAGEITVATGSVATLFASGADVPLTFGFAADAIVVLEGLGLTSNGVALDYAIVGNTVTASTAAGDVFTFELNADGGWEFTLIDQLDHAEGNDENDLTIQLGSIIEATDADGDSATAFAGGLVITVDDDTPTASAAHVTGLVDEDGVVEGAADGGEGDGIAGGVGDVEGAPTVASGSVAAMFNSGADAPLSYGFAADAIAVLEGLGLTSNGVGLDYALLGNTITASTAAGDVFTFELNADGSWEFTLIDQLDHAEGADENDLTINLGNIVEATDADGDSVVGAADGLVITVDDDTPTASNAHVTGLVDEDGVVEGAPGTGPGDGLPGGVGDVPGAPTVAAGSVASMFNSGADAPLSYGFADNAVAVLQGLGLTSGGDALDYSILGNTVTASTAAGDVFTFELNADGSWEFTLIDQLDHATGNDENDLAINLGAIVEATDADGDSVVGNADGLVITVDDDTPANNVNGLTFFFDEDALTGGNAGGPNDGPGSGVGPLNASIAFLFNTGADEPLSFAMLADTSGLPALTSGGVAVTYSVVGNTLTASAGGTPVFTVVLNPANGDVTITLLDQLDHPSQDGTPDDNTENNLLLDLSSIFSAIDADGDPITLDPNSISVDIDDDTPVATTQQITGIVDEDGVVENGAPGLQEGDGIAGGTGDVAGEATVAVGNVSALFSAGADQPLTYSLSTITSGLPALTSGGIPVVYSVVGNTLTATAGPGGEVVFTFTLNATSGAYTFTLVDQLDHAQGGDENDLTIQLGSIIQATDFDGDTVTANSTVEQGLVITVDDDTPTASAAQVTGLVDEDGVVEAGTVGDGVPGGVGDVPGTDTVDTGSVVTMFNSGADEPLSYGFASNAVTVLQGLGLTSNHIALSYVVNGDTITASTAAGDVFTFQLTAGGDWTFTLIDQLDHATGNDENDLAIQLGAIVQATDKDGDSVVGNANGLVITVDDDTPVANNDLDLIFGGNGPATGNVITGADFGGGDANLTDGVADQTGADAPVSITAIASVNVPGNLDTDPSANFIIAGQYGTLTLNANGNYSYLRTTPDGGVQDVFTYTLTDADGDSVTATLTISIEDNFPQAGNVNVQLDDDALPGGNAGGTGDVNPDTANLSGNLPGSGGDAPLAFSVLLTGEPAGFDYVSGGAGILLIQQGGETKITVTVNANGSYTVVQNNPIDHPTPGVSEENVQFTVNYRVTDNDGDFADGTISIDVDDDTPTVSANAAVQLDDDALAGGNPGGTGDDPNATNTSGTLGHSFGADGAGTVAYLNTGAPLGFSYVVQGNGDLFVMQGGTHVLTLTVNATTGAYTVSQVDNIIHAAGSDENNQSFTINYRVTDGDGDTVDGSIVVNVDDDTPVAAIATTGQAVSVDESVGIQVDSNDTTNAGVIALFSGVTNVGTDADLPQYAQNASAIVNSTGSAVGADTPGTTVFSLDVSSAGVNSTLNTTAGNDILLFKEGALIVGRVSGGPDDGKAAFAIAINPSTGVVSMVEYLSIQHPNAADPDDVMSILNTAVLAVVTVTDADNDTATQSVAIGSQIQFQDSAPVMEAASDINIQNSGDVAHTGTFDFNLGADGAATNNNVITAVTWSAIVNGVTVQTTTPLTEVSENATTAVYNFSFTYSTGIGTATTNGVLTFNKVAGTYTVDLDNPIQGVTVLQTATGTLFQGYEFGTANLDGSQPEISVTQILGTPGNPQPTDMFIQFTSVAEPSSGTGDDALEFTPWVPGADNPDRVDGGGDTTWTAGDLFNQDDSWVSTSNDANGVAGDTIQGGEVLDFMIVKGANPTGTLAQPTAFGQATTMFLKFDGIGASEDMIIVLKLFDTSTMTYTTKALMVQNSDIQKGPGSGPGMFSSITLDQNDGLIIIEPNDYQQGNTNLVIVGAQIAGSDEGLSGTAIDFTYGGVLGVASTGTQDFSTDVSDGPMKISSIGILSPSTTNQNAELTFNVTVTDGDGDSITQTIVADVTQNPDSSTPIVLGGGVTTINAVGSGESTGGDSSFSNLSFSNDNGKVNGHGNDKNFSAVNNTGIVAGIVAAAGLQSTAIAGSPSIESSFDVGLQDMMQSVSLPAYQLQSLSGDSLNVQTFGLESSEPAFDFSALQGSGHNFSDFVSDGGLDIQSYADAATAYQPSFAANQAPTFDASMLVASVAPTVGMPSAEALIAAGVAGVQQGGSVEQILADALSNQAPTVDGLLEAVNGGGEVLSSAIEAALHALPNGGGAGDLSAVLNGSSPDIGSVSSWDMSMPGSIGAGFDMMFKMDVATLHQDAVQPTVNG